LRELDIGNEVKIRLPDWDANVDLFFEQENGSWRIVRVILY
jgi:hypothetical protein